MSRLGYYLNYAYAYMKIYSKMAIKAILGLLIIGIVYWRILFHLRNSQLWKSDTCPRCKKNSLKRIHRTSFDRFLSNITRLHFRRFKCSSCSWTGLLRSSDRLHRLPDEFSPDETPGVNVWKASKALKGMKLTQKKQSTSPKSRTVISSVLLFFMLYWNYRKCVNDKPG